MPVNPDYIKSKIDFIREEIGRDVTFYTSTVNTDFVASGLYDPMTYTGYIPVTEATTVKARIHWVNTEKITMTPGGKYYVEDCTLGIDPEYHELAQQAMKETGKVLVDGHEMHITRIDAVGAPTINRYRVVCKSIGGQPPA